MEYLIASFFFLMGVLLMSVALDRLKREVEETRGVAASAVALIASIPQLIRDAIANSEGDLEAELNELADGLDAAQADLAGAINANPGPADPVDTVEGGNGDDTVSEDDTLEGGEGDDTVEGDA